MLGSKKRDEMTGAPWEKVSVDTSATIDTNEIRTALKDSGRWYGIVNIPRVEGNSVPVELGVTALPEGGVVLLSRDLTERRKAEQARAEAESKYQMIVEKVAAISYGLNRE